MALNQRPQFLSKAICKFLGFFLMISLGFSQQMAMAQEVSFPADGCLLCHEAIFDHLPEYVHRPFEEEKCLFCHKYQFMEMTNYKYAFHSLVPENTYYFRLRGCIPEQALIHVSQIYSFVPPSTGGEAIGFPNSSGYTHLELLADLWNPSTANLSWQIDTPEYCLIESASEETLSHAEPIHIENTEYLREIGITVCYRCHPKSTLGVTHPVDIIPSVEIKERMKKSNLPTGYNGLLLCITCHLPHASREKYLGQRVVAEELCVACHPKEIYNPK